MSLESELFGFLGGIGTGSSEAVGGGIIKSFLIWGVLSQLLGGVLSPATAELTNLTNEAAPLTALPLADAVDLVARSLIESGEGEQEARRAGINPHRFGNMVRGRQSVPPLSAVLDLWRRQRSGVGGPGITDAELDAALADLAIRPEWRGIVTALSYEAPSWQQALNALLQGQLPRDEALAWYRRGGGDPEAFDWLFNANGTAPTPVELSVMANRGAIPWDGQGPQSVSFHQGFLEGPWRDKWEAPYRALAVYHPPPRTVTALLKAGSITHDQAITLLRQQGLSAELAAAYVADAEHHTTTTHKHLAQSDILALYHTHAMNAEQATQALVALGYTAADAAEVLKVADVRQAAAQLSTAVTRVRSLFVGHKLDSNTARGDLVALGVPTVQAGAMVDTWTLERSANHRPLTPAQVADAWQANLLTQDEAQSELEGMGYHPRDAWIVLSLKNKGALPNKPPGAPTPIT